MGNKLLLVLLSIIPSLVVGKNYFTAAVFEHRPRGSINEEEPQLEILENLKYYEKAASVAAEKKADIIVFNEYGMFEYKKDRKLLRNYMEPVPNPEKQKFNPCNENIEDLLILHTLSCMAKNNNIYVVANMGDVKPCENTCDAKEIPDCSEKCSDDGFLMYNTDVAFDREGNLIARYHKMHPYFERVNVPEEPEFVKFKTDFGTFGLIVCFDSLFEESMILANYYDIDTLIFPTFWFDDIVPLNAVEWQQSWAFANRVNFLAANTQTPGNGSLGSGIFSKDHGALVYTYEPDGESKLLVANVPLEKKSNVETNPSITIITPDSAQPKFETGDKFPEQGYYELLGPENDHFLDYRYFKSQTENYILVKLQEENGRLEACNNGFCCNLAYETTGINEDFYLGAFSGLNNVKGYYHWCEETCLLVRCVAFEDKPCVMHTPQSTTVFKSFKLSAEFTSEKVYPTVTKSRHRLATKTEWEYERKEDETILTFSSKSQEPLIKAALMGRCYKNDPEFIPYYRGT